MYMYIYIYVYIYMYIYDGNEARLLISYSNLSHPTQDLCLYPDDKDTTGCLPGPRSRVEGITLRGSTMAMENPAFTALRLSING